jgi:hypothetical protein
MARPQKPILAQRQVDDTLWEVVAEDTYYVITYQGRAVNVKSTSWALNYRHKKYKKMAYPTEKSAQNQARRFNEIFQTTDFGYKRVGE